jgi:hypothetical protein
MEFPPPPPTPPGDKKSMGCLKIAAIGCGALMLLFFLIGMFGAIYFGRHKGELVTSTTNTMRDGIVAAKSTDEQGCVALAEARMKKGGMMTSAVSGTFFLESCLHSARETPGFCDNVPAPDEYAASAGWTRARCQSRSLNPADGTACNVSGQAIQRFCRQNRTKVDPDSALRKLEATAARMRDTAR